MNYTQTFEEFSKGLAPVDLALYAGIGIILWVLFKDKLSPIQKILMGMFNNIKQQLPDSIDVIVPAIPDSFPSKTTKTEKSNSEDVFFDLVVSWKQTRDLAEKSGCDKAVEVADEMFPYLSPTICDDKPFFSGDKNE
tara:strand:+ start:19814 stop:20224 length:411 start_codon:yes stop_codon:yes gene_type:complete